MSKRIEPHGGSLQVLYLPADEAAAAKRQSVDLPSWPLTQRQLCDIKLLLNGGFSPLTGFLNEADYDRVLEAMRLADGTLWPMPVTLDVTAAAAEPLAVGDRLALRDHEGWLIAILAIESMWRPDKRREAERVFATADEEHPGVDYLLNRTHPVYLGGRLVGIEKPVDHDFIQYRHEPADLRHLFDQRGWSRVVAYQTRTPMHRAH
jgi:sulfate adenylyltransferase